MKSLMASGSFIESMFGESQRRDEQERERMEVWMVPAEAGSYQNNE